MTAIPGGRGALDVRRPFTREQALGAGITDRQLEGPGFRSLLRGVHVSADVPFTPRLMASAALSLFPPHAHASHDTAARIYGLPVRTRPLEHVTVRQKSDRRRRRGLCCHVNPRSATRTVDGIRVSAPEQLFVELGPLLPLVELVVVGDHLVRKGLVSLRRIREFCADARGQGAAQARAAAVFVRERVDSPMETRLRMLIVLAGLPEPRVNLTFGDEEGLVLRRYDLCWPEARLIVEYDGRHHIERVEQWESDLARREKIDDDRWRIVVVIRKGVYETPGATLRKIHALLLERKMPGTPRELAGEWSRHFPGRG